ncbi:hypothetical protein ACC686_37200, partial [Rhizobium johnstonii]
NQLGAECFMFLAPLLVDSIETKRNLIEKCGLDTIYRLAENLDLANQLGAECFMFLAPLLVDSIETKRNL